MNKVRGVFERGLNETAERGGPLDVLICKIQKSAVEWFFPAHENSLTSLGQGVRL